MKVKKYPIIFLTFFLLSLDWTYAFINRQSSYIAVKHSTNTFYVKLSSSPFTSSPGHIEVQHSTFHEELKNLGIDSKIVHTFKRYANGIVIETDDRHVKRIAEIEHVESIEPVRLYKRSKQDKPIEFNFNKDNKLIKRNSNDESILIAPNNDINSIHEITGVKKVHEKLKLTGKGVKVGIIDAGIDYRHPALGGCFGPGCRVAYGYNFVNETDDPLDDCDGHGTHVAGIIGGLDLKTGFKGVAPNVIFGAYKILPCDGNSFDEIVSFDITLMRVIEKAIDDGMEIINISIGFSGNARSPATLMIDELAKHKGIIFTISIGNEGLGGVLTANHPGVAHNSIAVGSFGTNKVLNFKAKGPNFVINYIKGNSEAYPFNKAKIKILSCVNDYNVFNNTIIIEDDRNKLDCDFTNKFVNLTVLGKIIVYSESNEGVTPDHDSLEASITNKQADFLNKYLEKHPNLELDFSDKYGYMEELEFAVTPSIFSSWGLTDEFDIKPDICGPGGFILSSFPINIAPYVTISGTSMSTPYVAGVAALYTEVFRKQKSFEQLKTAFINYAIPRKDRNQLLSPVLHQGAGFISIYDTLRATSFVYPSKINLNDTTHFNKHHTLTIYNAGRKEMKYKLSHLPAPSVNGYNKTLARNYFQLEYFTKNYASITFEKDLITVAPESSVKVSVTFTPPTNLPKNDHWFYSGWLEVIPLDNETMPKMSVPYAGLADDARRLPLFQLPEFPRLSNFTHLIMDDDKIKTFTYNDTDVPVIQLYLATSIHKIVVEILDGNHKFLGIVKIPNDLYTAKKKPPFPPIWDGFIYDDPNNENDEGSLAPNGKYFLRVKALKLFGDINNKKDYEVWVSPKFIIERTGKVNIWT